MREKLLGMNDRRKKEKRSPRGMRERERSSVAFGLITWDLPF